MPQYPISLPNGDPAAQLTLHMHDITRANVSPYNGAGEFEDWDTGWWGLTITIPPLGRDVGQKWISFLAKLQGRSGTFQATVPGHEVPLGACAEDPGIPRVDGAAQEGDRIWCDGMPSNQHEYLAEGDFIQIGTRLYVVTDRVNTNNAGAAWLPVWPRVDGEHGDDVRVIVAGATGLFRLKDDHRSVDITGFDTYGAVIDAEEVR